MTLNAASPGRIVASPGKIVDEWSLKALWAAVDRAAAVIEFDLQGRILTANQNFLDMTGYGLDELTGKPHGMLCEPAHAASPEYEDFWNRLRRGEFESGEFRRIGRDGRRITIQATYNPIFNAVGQPCKIVKIATDVTAAKRREAEFEGKVRAIDRALAVIEFDLQGRVLTANQNYLDMLGYRLEDIAGRRHSLFCDADYAASTEYARFWDRLRCGEYAAGTYLRFGKNGRKVWIQATYNPVFDADGLPCSVVKFATDITAEKIAGADYQGKVAAIDRAQAVIEFDLQGNILAANRNALDMLGYRLEEVAGAHHRIFCDPDYAASPEYRAFWQSLRRGEFQSGEFGRVGKSGRRVWVLANYNPIFDAEGNPCKVVKFATDVTASRMAGAEARGMIAAIDRAQAVAEFDLHGRILFTNQNFLDLTGYRADEILGQDHSIFCDPDVVSSPAYRDFWLKLGRGEHQSGRFARLGKHHLELWVQATYNPILDADGTPTKIVLLSSDISAQVALEQNIHAKTAAMSGAIANLNATIEAIAANTRLTTELAQDSREAARAGSEALQGAQEAIGALQHGCAAIAGLAAALRDITGQTNLLAFNAAIEAARAGEAGLGLAVIADEIHRLAEKAAATLQDVDRLIADLVPRGAAGQAVSAKAREAFDRIVADIGKTSTSIRNINAAAVKQLSDANEVEALIQDVTRFRTVFQDAPAPALSHVVAA